MDLFKLLLLQPPSEWTRSLRFIPFFQACDPAVLEIYVEFGIQLTKNEHTWKEIPKHKMPGIQEFFIFGYIGRNILAVNLDGSIVVDTWKSGAEEIGPPGSGRGHLHVSFFLFCCYLQKTIIRRQIAPQELDMPLFFLFGIIYFSWWPRQIYLHHSNLKRVLGVIYNFISKINYHNSCAPICLR